MTATNYTDTTAMAGNTYYYVVKAVNGAAISPASNAASATVANTCPRPKSIWPASTTWRASLTTAQFSGGLDGHGNALSAHRSRAPAPAWNGVNFSHRTGRRQQRDSSDRADHHAAERLVLGGRFVGDRRERQPGEIRCSR